MAERSRFQFRMRDLLWAVSLIGVSLGLALAFVRLRARYDFEYQANAMDATGPVFLWYWLCIATYLASGVTGGAGIGWVFRIPLWGSLLGAFFVLAIHIVSLRLGYPLLPPNWK